MPSTTLLLPYSPLAGSSSAIYCRVAGSGFPVVYLHGGWGYEIYPLTPEQHLEGCSIIVPDRSGYGRSSKPADFNQAGFLQTGFGRDFHQRAAQETILCLDQLGIEQFVLWGHSDGAVIAAMIGLSQPDRCLGVILEALHYDARKGARDFFQAMISAPDSFGSRTTAVLAREHGEPYWRDLLRAEGAAWVDIAAAADDGHHDLYAGRLSQLEVPTVIIHGECDPRTEPAELESVRRELPSAAFHLIKNAGHSPHSEAASAEQCTEIVRDAVNVWSKNQNLTTETRRHGEEQGGNTA